jgi:hypothetical protein
MILLLNNTLDYLLLNFNYVRLGYGSLAHNFKK